MILYHPFDIEVFQYDHIVAFDEIGGKLMFKVKSAVTDLLMYLCDLLSLFLNIGTLSERTFVYGIPSAVTLFIVIDIVFNLL